MDSETYKINFKGLRQVTRYKYITPTARLLLVNLLLYAGIHAKSFPSRSRLAKDIGVSTRQIGNLLNELRDNRLIGWKKSDGYPAHNMYYFSDLIYDYGSLRSDE